MKNLEFNPDTDQPPTVSQLLFLPWWNSKNIWSILFDHKTENISSDLVPTEWRRLKPLENNTSIAIVTLHEHASVLTHLWFLCHYFFFLHFPSGCWLVGGSVVKILWGKRRFSEGIRGFLCGSAVKSLPARQVMRVWSLGQEDPLEKEMAAHCSILAWKIS